MPATPSNLVTEATGTTTVSLFWDISAADGTTYDVKRALHGGSLATIATTAANATSYNDTGLSAGTRYDYQVCQAGSATCTVASSVTSVVTGECNPGLNLSTSVTQLIRSSEPDAPTTTDFNQLAQQVETLFNQSSETQDTACTICSTNGAVIFDCSRCTNFSVLMTEDINSITFHNCDNVDDGNVNITIPPGGTRKICGWPTGFGNEGGECKDNHSGGDGGSTFHFPFGPGPKMKPGAGGATSKPVGGGGGGGGGTLTLTCQTGAGGLNSSCSIDCAGITSTPRKLRVVASGGSPPYVFSVTGGLTVTIINATTADITPPVNGSPGTAGTAYSTHWKNCTPSGFTTVVNEAFSCADAVTGTSNFSPPQNCDPCVAAYSNACQNGIGTCACNVPTPFCGAALNNKACNSLINCGSGAPGEATGGTISIGAKVVCDRRTAPMIAAGCSPCGVSSASKVVTVTDNVGTMVSKTITV